jgi:hypothetical protein
MDAAVPRMPGKPQIARGTQDLKTPRRNPHQGVPATKHIFPPRLAVMRLINTTTLQLQDFVDGDIPSYAILSHRWGKDEVIRLQEEILRVSKDHTIFAWNYSYRDITESGMAGSFLAVSPASFQFHSGKDIMPTDPNDIQSKPISVDSEGIHLVLHVYEPQWNPDWRSYVRQVVLPCRYGDRWIALTLAMAEGPDKRVGQIAFLDPRKTDLRAAQYGKLCVAHERRARKRPSALSRSFRGCRRALAKRSCRLFEEALSDLLARLILQPINWNAEQTEMVATAERIFQSLEPSTARAVAEQVSGRLDFRSSEHFTLVMLFRRLLEDALGS